MLGFRSIAPWLFSLFLVAQGGSARAQAPTFDVVDASTPVRTIATTRHGTLYRLERSEGPLTCLVSADGRQACSTRRIPPLALGRSLIAVGAIGSTATALTFVGLGMQSLGCHWEGCRALTARDAAFLISAQGIAGALLFTGVGMRARFSRRHGELVRSLSLSIAPGVDRERGLRELGLVLRGAF